MNVDGRQSRSKGLPAIGSPAACRYSDFTRSSTFIGGSKPRFPYLSVSSVATSLPAALAVTVLVILGGCRA